MQSLVSSEQSDLGSDAPLLLYLSSLAVVPNRIWVVMSCQASVLTRLPAAPEQPGLDVAAGCISAAMLGSSCSHPVHLSSLARVLITPRPGLGLDTTSLLLLSALGSHAWVSMQPPTAHLSGWFGS